MLKLLLYIALVQSVLVSPELGLSASVSVYRDCRGRTPLSSHEAQVIDCPFTPQRVMLMGHTPGVFSSLHQARVGTHLFYRDSSQREYNLEVIDVSRVAGHTVPSLPRGATYQLETCDAPFDGSRVLLLSAKLDD